MTYMALAFGLFDCEISNSFPELSYALIAASRSD